MGAVRGRGWALAHALLARGHEQGSGRCRRRQTKDRDRSVVADAKEARLGGFYDLPSNAILDRGRLIGLWEYDPESSSIVWATFGLKKTKALQQKIDETEAFVRDQLGDARAFSLDSPKSRKPRIDALRRMA